MSSVDVRTCFVAVATLWPIERLAHSTCEHIAKNARYHVTLRKRPCVNFYHPSIPSPFRNKIIHIRYRTPAALIINCSRSLFQSFNLRGLQFPLSDVVSLPMLFILFALCVAHPTKLIENCAHSIL